MFNCLKPIAIICLYTNCKENENYNPRDEREDQTFWLDKIFLKYKQYQEINLGVNKPVCMTEYQWTGHSGPHSSHTLTSLKNKNWS